MTLQKKSKTAILVLENGEVFKGFSIGALGVTVGEVVFNTSMTGYQEILTDPSYCKQIVTLTYPHIGNTGINNEDVESDNVWAAGLVVRDYPQLASNFRSEQSLCDYLQAHNIVAIAGIDTRHLTNILRENGAQKGCIVTAESISDKLSAQQALEQANAFSGLKGMDLAKKVSTKTIYHWRKPTWQLASSATNNDAASTAKFKVVAYDFGIKHNILRMLVDRQCDIIVVPATTSADDVLALNPDGIFLSNGPGDPEPCDYAIEAIKQLLKTGITIFGICLGHQLLGLASGAQTRKMKFGHHGANHPVLDITNGNVLITSQNHGFDVDETSLPDILKVTHRSLFDQSLQGIERTDCPAFSFQGHPEASPGPHEAASLFDHFIDLMTQHTRSNNTDGGAGNA